MKSVTSSAIRMKRHRELVARSLPLQQVLRAAELAYLRDRQQAVFTLAFVSRIERLLLAHPQYIRRFDLLLKDVNSDIRQKAGGPTQQAPSRSLVSGDQRQQRHKAA